MRIFPRDFSRTTRLCHQKLNNAQQTKKSGINASECGINCDDSRAIDIINEISFRAL